ncbi:hypothetical protein FOL47_010419 [Perkinsus chesapeaki]|uniref:EF-hand domain-containing protein n=1 Tax=Perkinsus chesapeaki TaxID=330153 RepID=A0A7J6L2D5_PERCH|nr:hypothetical protein FOL47_010419 [Perkinsus chesapeaki]
MSSLSVPPTPTGESNGNWKLDRLSVAARQKEKSIVNSGTPKSSKPHLSITIPDSEVIPDSSSFNGSEDDIRPRINTSLWRKLVTRQLSVRAVSIRAVESRKANMFFSAMVLLNSVSVGLETDLDVNDDSVSWLIINSIFLVIFAVELFLRLENEGWRSWVRDTWNWFDTLLVLSDVVGMWIVPFFTGESLASFNFLRTGRLLRLARIARLFRFLRPLALIMRGIYCAFKIVLWMVILMTILIYVAAVGMRIFTKNIANDWKDDLGNPDSELLAKGLGTYGQPPFRSVPQSMLTMFQLVTLENWPEIFYATNHYVSIIALTIIPFVFFMNFIIVSLMTGVILENVLEVSRTDYEEKNRRNEEFRQAAFNHLHEVFKEADKDGRGWISEDEFVKVLRNEDVMQRLKFVEVSLRDAAELFGLIDISQSRRVTYTEFVEGCLRIAGPAKGKDLLRVQYTLDKKFERVRQELAGNERSIVNRMESNSRRLGVKLDLLLANSLADKGEKEINGIIRRSLRGLIEEGLIVEGKRLANDEVIGDWLAGVSGLPHFEPERILKVAAKCEDLREVRDGLNRLFDRKGWKPQRRETAEEDEDDVEVTNLRVREERNTALLAEDLHSLLTASPGALPELLSSRLSSDDSVMGESVTSGPRSEEGKTEPSSTESC